jgi:hypothetical protein
VTNPHTAGPVEYGHVFAKYTEGTADSSVDLDPYPDERWLTGTVTFRPAFSGQAATATLRIPDTPRARGMVITEVEYKIVASQLVDRQDREGVWLIVAVDEVAVYWQVTVNLMDVRGRAVLSRPYLIGPEAWVEAEDGTLTLNLPDLVASPSALPPAGTEAVLAAQLSAQQAEQFANAAAGAVEVVTQARDGAVDAEGEAEQHADRAETKAGEADSSARAAVAARDAAQQVQNNVQWVRDNDIYPARDAAVAARLVWRGPWAADTQYATRDVVSYGGSSWWALRPSTGVVPAEGADWSLLAAKGDPGVSPTLPDATATVKGAVALAGNLTGTADEPVVTTTFTVNDGTEQVTQTMPLDEYAGGLYGAYVGMGAHLQYMDDQLVRKASLDGNGKVPAAQLPALAVTEFLGEVASGAAMLTLTGQKGDWCIRTDTSTSWIITGDNPAQVSSWTQLATPAAGVSSVAGRTGAVTLSKADVGLSQVDNTSDADKPVSTAVSTELSKKAASTHTHTPDSLGAVARSGAATGLWIGTGATLPTTGTDGVLYVTY